MNKWMAILLTGLIAAVVVSGCTADSNLEAVNPTTVGGSESNKDSNVNTTTSNPSLPEVGVLIQRMNEAGKELNSFSTEEDVYQIIVNRVSNTASTEQIVDSLTRSDIIKEPFQIHSSTQTKMHTEDMSMNMEQYVTKDAIYMKLGKDWMKMNEEMRVKAMPSMEEAGYPWRQLEPYRSVEDAMEVSEEGEHYVIRAKLNDSQLLKFAESYRNQTNVHGEPLMDNYSDLKIRKANLVYTVHKDTYYPVEISLSTDMDVTMSGNTFSIETERRSKYSNYGEIKEINIPQEVLAAP
ncbi:hypothetical protein YSY43_00870 [Paenibacillus sp. YSY-4.3]